MKPLVAVFALLVACDVAGQESASLVRVSAGEQVLILIEHGALSRPDYSPRNRVCVAQEGDEGEVVNAVMAAGATQFWAQVRFTSGPCAQQSGWISSERLVKR